MKYFQYLSLGAFLFTASVGGVYAQKIIIMNRESKEVKLDWLLKQDNLWAATPDDLEKGIGSANFEWQDKDRTHARFDADDFELRLNGTKVGETLVSFKEGKIASVVVSYLNKGDDYNIDRSAYTTAVTAAKTALGIAGATGVKEEVRPKAEQITKAETSLWRSPKGFMAVEHLFLPEQKITEDDWIYTIREHAEFVRLRMQPPTKQLGTGMEKFRTKATAQQLAAHVKRDGKKAVLDGIPMVNQGSKGYCAVASLERVLRYYGADLDMHDLANLANSYGGTKPEEMKRAVHQVATKLGMTSRFPLFLKQKDYKAMTANYNRAAEKAATTKAGEGENVFRVADNKVLMEMRTKSSDFAKFKQEIVADINRGLPVMWALYLGLFWEDQIEQSFEANRYAVNTKDSGDGNSDSSEYVRKRKEAQKEEMEKMRRDNPKPPEYMRGGHMRLIIGYDGQEGVIFYTDSWGPGHEVKKMKLEEAYAATLAVMVIEPR